MVKIKCLDEKDRKILLELDKNSRQTDSEIAKKVRLSKQVTNYRIQNLKKKKIISNFYTVVNAGNLGFNSYYVFLQFEKINKEQEDKLLKKINTLDYVGWLVSGLGRWDAVVLIYSDTISTFDKLLSKIINICGSHVHEYNFTTLITAEHINYKFLGDKESLRLKQTEKKLILKLDKIDKKILKVISQDARLSIVDISEKSKIPLHVVNYHLKSMIKQKIIDGFKPKIDVNKLGYQWHLILLQLQRVSEKRKEEFIKFCKQHKKIYYVTNTIGTYNLMLDIHIKTVKEFKEILLELKEKFSDVIKLYESIMIFEEYKINYFPSSLV
jgi:DNA-binding Lrp family transcriptional regulator